MKEVDIDGKFTYSNIAVVSLTKAASVTTFPNPFLSSLTVNFNSAASTVVMLKLSNASGATVRMLDQRIEKGATQIAIRNLDRLSAGIYFLELVDKSTGARISQKLIKNQ